MPTEIAVLGAKSLPVALSYFEIVLGLANDLNMSDGSLFGADNLLADFFSTTLGASAFMSGVARVLKVDPSDLLLDEGPANGLTAFFCSTLVPLMLPLAFSLIEFAKVVGAPIGGRFPVLR